jgi:hypothetical protein
MKQFCLVGILAGMLVSGAAYGQAEPQPGPADQAGMQQGQVAGPAGVVALGSVRIPRAVLADGKPLAAGTYQLRVTEETPEPVPGQTPGLARWVEMVQGGQVRARALATLIPQAEIDQVAQGPRPARGGSRVEMLKGGDYLRVWVHRGDYHYLLHLPPQQ